MLQISCPDMASKVLIDPSDVSCSICLDIFMDPRVLPCVHTFCYGCLEGWISKSESSQTITCPLCRDVSPIPPGGLTKIKHNSFISDLVARMHTMDLKSTYEEVEGPKENLPLRNVPYVYCQIHERNVIDQYCVTCDFAACGTCLLRDHRKHKLVDLEKQAAICRHQLQDVFMKTNVLQQLISKLIDESKAHDDRSTYYIGRIKRQITNVIDGMFSKLTSNLNGRRHKLFDSLDTIQSTKEKVMMTVHDGQQFSKVAVSSLRLYTHNLLHHGRDYDLVQQAGDIQSRLVSITKARVPCFIWIVHVAIAKNTSPRFIQRHFGKVAEISMTTDDTDHERKGIRDNVVCRIPTLFWKYDTVRGMVVISQTLFFANHNESYLYAYSVTSPHQPQKLSIQELSDPRDMVRFPPGQSQLVISDYVNKKLLWINVDQRNGEWKVTSERTVKVSYGPQGLSVHDNQLLVCDPNNHTIHVFSTSGEEIHIVNMPKGVAPWKAVARLTSPGYVITNSREVFVVTEEGEILQIFRCGRLFFLVTLFVTVTRSMSLTMTV